PSPHPKSRQGFPVVCKRRRRISGSDRPASASATASIQDISPPTPSTLPPNSHYAPAFLLADTSIRRCRGRPLSCGGKREWRRRQMTRCPERWYVPDASRPCHHTTMRAAGCLPPLEVDCLSANR